MNYFVLECEGSAPIARIRCQLGLPGGAWYKGSRLGPVVRSEIELPMQFNCVKYPEGSLKSLYTGLQYPLMSSALFAVLEKAGVDNLESFPAKISFTGSRPDSLDYVAFNVVGLVSATDFANSELMESGAKGLLGSDFKSLTIDEEKAGNLLLFRLAENCSAIVVHARIKAAIEAAGIEGIVFYGPGEWSG